MTLLAIAAEALELRPWLRRCQQVEPLGWAVARVHRALWNGHTLYAIANGAGQRLAAIALGEAMRRVPAFDGVLSIGLCGALDPALPLNAVCTASATAGANGDWPCHPLPGAHPARLLSTDSFLGQPAEKRQAFEHGFEIVDMEAAASAAWAAERRIPFYAAKVVSDRAAESFALDFNLYRDPEGGFDRRRIAAAALRSPLRRLPDLIRMARRGKAASEILGDFLAKLRF